jgi:thiol:disulfide interchange protein/DsbC/DsbD-like thiol-disulfide interchange protein
MPLSLFFRLRQAVPLWRVALGSLLLLAGSAQAQSFLETTQVRSPQVSAELLAHAPQGAAPGATVWLGLQLAHAPDWHTYWKNSGDSGLPTELQWSLPVGVSAGPIAWPTPRKFPIGNLANYGYNGTVLLPVPLTIDPLFQGRQIDVQLQASWLVCRKECIPEEGSFKLSLPVQQSTAVHGAVFDAAFKAAPLALASADSRLAPEPGFLNLDLKDLPPAWRGQTLEFFPESPGLIEPGAAWTQAWDGAHWRARVPLTPQRGESPERMALVVAQAQAPGEGAGTPGRRLDLPVSGAWPPVTAIKAEVPDALAAALAANSVRFSAVPPAQPSGGGAALALALLGALLGGLILNLMPCVFPVLAIKVLAFAQHADDPRGHRASGWAYSAGVVLSFLALGGLLLGLRAAGEAIGWGFQLQSPAVVAALATLFTLIGLNLAGLFEFGSVLPSSLATLQAKSPRTDAFLTGVLATAIASPCTAPFMGASLGLAIGLPAWQALAVFGALGVGMALPYWLASHWPALARALPRPGAWMQTLRQFLAFPMFATVVWLFWVLGQQSGIDGAATLLMLLVLLALLVWALGLGRRARRVLAPMALVGLLWLGWAMGPQLTRPAEAATAPPVATDVQGLGWSPWSAERQAALLAQGRPVFVDFTAAWCVTCQYNKRTTLADAEVLADMGAKNVALLRADWTRRDPAITAALSALGRNGVPVYAIHKTGQPSQVLSEVLSVREVRAALSGL